MWKLKNEVGRGMYAKIYQACDSKGDYVKLY